MKPRCGTPPIARHVPLLTEALAHVAHPAIRARGTIGGNLAHADPASELPACMLALNATIEATSPRGTRRIAAEDFFAGLFQTALEPDEMLTAVEIPLPAPAWFFQEIVRRSGDYAIVGLAASGTGWRFSRSPTGPCCGNRARRWTLIHPVICRQPGQRGCISPVCCATGHCWR